MELEKKLYQEGLELASISNRFFAFFIDKLIVSSVFLFIYWGDFSQLYQNYYAMISFLSSVIWQYLSLSLIYEILFVMMYGATFGKMLLKIRIISVVLLDSPSFFSSFVRSIVKILGENLFYFPYFFVFFTPFRQSLHDILAKSIVIKNV